MKRSEAIVMQVTLTSQRYKGVSVHQLSGGARARGALPDVRTVTFCGLLLSLVLASWAQAGTFNGLYLEADFGRARNNYDTKSLDSQWQGLAAEEHQTLKITARSDERDADVWSASAGYLFSDYVGVEAGFVHAGELRHAARATVSAAGTAVQNASLNAEVTSHGPLLALIGRLPLLEGVDLDVRVGAYDGRSVFDDVLTLGNHSAPGSAEKSKVSLLAGVGVGVKVVDQLSFRVAYLHLNHTGDAATTGRFNVDMATAGVRWMF